MTTLKDKNKSLESIEQLEKIVEQLRKKYNELDKKYIEYLEVDMNKQAGIVNKRKKEVEQEIYFLEGRIESKKEIKRIKEEEMYGISQKMKKDLKLYEMFLIDKNLIDEFDKFKEEQQKEKKILIDTNYLENDIDNENIFFIQKELGELGVTIYKKYYEWYRKNGVYDFTEYIDSFCYGKVRDIKDILNEVIKFTKKDKEISNENKIIIIEQAEEFKKKLNEYQMLKEEEVERND